MKGIVKNALLTMGIVVSLASQNAFAYDLTVYLDGGPIEYCEELNEEGQPLFPLRDICETSGSDISWDPNNALIKIRNERWKSSISPIRNEVIANGEKSQLDVSPQIIDGRTYVSEDTIQKCFNFDTLWDETTKTLYLERDNEVDKGQQLETITTTYEKEDDGKKAVFKIKSVQILNDDNDDAIEQINNHCIHLQHKWDIELNDDYLNVVKNTNVPEKLLDIASFEENSDISDYDEYNIYYEIGYNGNNILSVINYKLTPGIYSVKGDVYNTRTGKRLKIEDILQDGTVDGIKKALHIGYQEVLKQDPKLYNKSYEEGLAKKAMAIKEEDELSEASFYIEGKDLVFVFYSSWLNNIKINIDEHKDLFSPSFLDDFYGLVKSLERTRNTGEVYDMPYINLNTQDAAKINNAIEEFYKSLDDIDVTWTAKREGDVLHIDVSCLDKNLSYDFTL